MKFITRAEWGARPAKAGASAIPLGRLTVHWEGPHMGIFPHAACYTKVRGIQAFHMDGRGWNDIAYSVVVCPHGYVFEGRGRGHRTAANGTNAGNDSWHAACYLSGEGDPFTREAQQGIRDVAVWVSAREVNGHRDHKSTACPGDTIYAWVHSGAALTPGAPTQGDDDLDRAELDEALVEADERAKAREAATESRLSAEIERNKRKLNRLLEHFGLKDDDDEEEDG